LWAALEANAPLELTGKAGANGSVVDVTPTEEPAPETTTEPSATVAPTEAPAQEAVVLPNSITGSTAAQSTCSVGNLG
ncbi:MAG: LytR family transcriptional regulator, partial [Micrococcales bacterium]|nr:LytR family transcriptional regulator [Micrococcales bacterium]